MASNRVVVLLYIFCYSLTDSLAESLTADVVFDVLSRRFDFVIREIDTVKSSVAELKTDVSRLDKKIENIEKNVSEILTIAEAKEERISKSGMQNKIKRQSRALQKMLATEKTILREAVDNLQDMFSDLQLDIKSQMSSMNFSVGNSIKEIEHTVSEHIADTNTKLRDMDTELALGINETDNRVEDMRQEVIKMSEESVKTVNEVGESIKATATQDVSNVKNDFTYKLNSEISKVTSQLNSLERRQERHENEADDNISDLKRRISNEESYTSGLSERISAEEERKVAFSARLITKYSYYGKDERIVFDDVEYSYGGGYDSSTGIFTAPKSGTYLFTFNVESTRSGWAHVGLMVRGYSKTSAIAESGVAVTGGNAGIEYLSKGDKAWIETFALRSRYYIWPWRTTFNGILID